MIMYYNVRVRSKRTGAIIVVHERIPTKREAMKIARACLRDVTTYNQRRTHAVDLLTFTCTAETIK